MAERSELLTTFKDVLKYDAYGMLENEELVAIFLNESEKIDVSTMENMWHWAYDNDLSFVGIMFEKDSEKIYIDEWFESQYGEYEATQCMTALFRKGRWKYE